MAPLATLEGHSDLVYCVAIGDVRGKMVLASGGGYGDNSVIVWDLATNKQEGGGLPPLPQAPQPTPGIFSGNNLTTAEKEEVLFLLTGP